MPFMEVDSLFQATLGKTDYSDDGKTIDALESVGKRATCDLGKIRTRDYEIQIHKD